MLMHLHILPLSTTHIADGDVYDEAGYGASDAQYGQQQQQQHDAILDDG